MGDREIKRAGYDLHGAIIRCIKKGREQRMASVISLKGLTKVYGDKRVVDNFSLDVEKGHIYGLIGPNGAGKTTIMKMIAGLIDPVEGEIELFGSG